MTVMEFAMKMEKDGEKFYRDLAAAATDKGLAVIANELADAEAKHYLVFDAMRESRKMDLGESRILSNAKNIFAKMAESGTRTGFLESEVRLYRKAKEIEQQSIDFYTKSAQETANPGEKEVLLRVAEEEKKHFFLVVNMIEFMSRPSNWLEFSEWNHLDE
jgi:rubrerythrin